MSQAEDARTAPAADGMPISLAGVSKTFLSLRRKVTALQGVSLEIRRGEFFVLLGPSGCGKSTLLNVIAGLERVTEGAVRFGEELVTSAEPNVCLPPRARNVAMVFQHYALYPHMSVRENIAFPLSVAGTPKPEIAGAVDRMAGLLDIAGLLPAKPAELSGGQRQRVAIARALIRRPRCFLLDEPLSNLDAQLRQSMRIELKLLQRRLGVTTVYVTHDQTEAMTLGDRIAVLRNGVVEQVGTPHELYHRPANPFVARFVGSPPMNLLPVSIREEGGRFVALLGQATLPMPQSTWERCRSLKGAGGLLGIRPEHIRLSPSADAERLDAAVEAVEPVGRETFVHLLVGGHKVIGITGKPYQVGESLKLSFDLDHAHLFEGQALA